MNRMFAAFLVCTACLTADRAPAGSFFTGRSGISLRGSYWSAGGHETVIRTGYCCPGDERVEFGGGGGWITFLAGVGERGAIEFSWGGLGRVKTVREGFSREYTDVSGVMPVLIGFQWALFPDRNLSAFQPYLSAAGGPYVASDVRVIERGFLSDEVTVSNRMLPGACAGAGAYFSISRWFALHGEMRYHLVNMDPDHEHTGVELGLGAAFFWKR
ncbi:hypothetical protein JW777_07290 [bacterium]|nr:hypothetical protein [bacterium]